MELIYKILVLVILFMIVRGLYLGITKKAVFYMDKEDMIISLSVWLIPLIGTFIISFLEWEWLYYILALIVLAIIAYVVFSAYHYNQDNLSIAIPIALGKIVLSGATILYAFRSYDDMTNTEISFKEATVTTAIFGFLSMLLTKLVNGKEVYRLNKWELRESALDRLNKEEEEDSPISDAEQGESIAVNTQGDRDKLRKKFDDFRKDIKE